MNDWKEHKVADLIEAGCLSIGDGYRAKNSELGSNGIPFARVSNINGGFHFDGADLFPIEDLKKVGEKIGRTGDIVFTSKGTVGRFAFVKEGTPEFVYSPQLCYWRSRKQDAIDSKYLFYWMQGREFYEQVEAVKGQTDMADYVNLADQRQMKITLPPSSEQASIASILSSLDDKIDLLHRQNKTLEGLAEVVFREWFVEGAKEEWDEKGLDEVAEFLNGLACQKYPPKPTEVGLPVIKIKEMKAGITDASDIVTEDVPEKYIVQDGDMLFSWSGSLDVVLWSGGTGVLNQHLFKVTSNEFPQWYYYFWVKRHLTEFKGVAEDKATTMGHIQRHHLSDAMVLVSSNQELEEMDKTMKPLIEKIKANNQQIRTLTQTRDGLLPRLMSGEVRVENI